MKTTPATAVAFTPYEISMCLFDVQRTRLWKQAIEDTVEDGDVVADAGSGTGILGVFAALDHASRVYSIELHPRFLRLIENLAKRNGVSDVVRTIEGNAAHVDLPEPIDVLVCELLCTGQFFEPEVQVVNNLRRFFKPTTRVIPCRVESWVQLLDAQEILYGARIDTDSRSGLLEGDEYLSTCERYDVIDLTRPVEPEAVDATVTVRARKDGVADAVVITSQAHLTERLVTETTRFLYNPEVIFLKEPAPLAKGRDYRVHIAYPYGCDTLEARIEVE
jgi:predicted RNA methylase